MVRSSGSSRLIMNEIAKKFKILLIEDNFFDYKLVSLYLNDGVDYFFDITYTSTLKEGVQASKQEQYDVVLLDMTLPDSNGKDTIKKFLSQSPDNTVIVLTGYDDMNVALEALSYGAADYVVKSDIENGLLKKSILYSYHSRKNEDLLKAKELAERSAEMKHRFLAQMSHELRTPLNVISGLINLMGKTNLDAKQKEYINTLKQSSSHLLSLINDILDYSKLESGKIVMLPVPVDIYTLTKELVNTYNYKAIEKELILKNRVDIEVPKHIITDSKRLSQLLMILIDNALKFTEKGEVVLGTECIHKDENKVLLKFYVSDSGIGIAKQDQALIFESFAQGKNQKLNSQSGTGLGLAIGQEVAKMFGTVLTLTSEENKGSTFSFVIQASIVTDDSMSLPIIDTFDGYSVNLVADILLVEDHLMNQYVMRELIHKVLPGIKLTIVNNGREALEIINDRKFDLILMDISMPEMDGYETTRAIRSLASNQNHNIPIIALSARSLKAEIEQCFQVGMNDFISKPIQESDLLQKLNKFLNQSSDDTQTTNLNTNMLSDPLEFNFNFSYLDHLSNGNKSLKFEMMSSLIDELGKDLAELIVAYKNDYIKEYYQKAHKLKTTMAYLGLREHPVIIDVLINPPLDGVKFPFSNLQLDQLEEICKKAMIEMKNQVLGNG